MRNLAPTTYAPIDPSKPGVLNYTITFNCPTYSSWFLLVPYPPLGVLNDPQPGQEPDLNSQRTVAPSAALEGSFQLSYNGTLTTPLQFYASSSDFVNALEAITGVRTVDVYGSTSNIYDGGTWYVTLWAPYGVTPQVSVVTTAPIPGTNTTRDLLRGSSVSSLVTVLQNASTDALLWPIPMDFFQYASPGTPSRSVGGSAGLANDADPAPPLQSPRCL